MFIMAGPTGPTAFHISSVGAHSLFMSCDGTVLPAHHCLRWLGEL
jgi:hypothetical protein